MKYLVGDHDEARKYFSRCLTLNTKMIDLLMDILDSLEIEYMFAPYEADAQLTYMVRE